MFPHIFQLYLFAEKPLMLHLITCEDAEKKRTGDNGRTHSREKKNVL